MLLSDDVLRTMIDQMPTIVWSCRPDGSAEFVNQRWLDYTGLSIEEAVGWGWQATVHPEDLGRTTETWLRIVASEEPGEEEARVRRFDGEYRWFLFRAVPVRDERGKVIRWYGTSTDIEDRKQAEEKLRQDERELRRITDAIAQPIGVLAPDGSTFYANQMGLDYTGLSLEDIKAADFPAETVHPDDLERVRNERQRGLSGGEPFQVEQRVRPKTGSTVGFWAASIRCGTTRDALFAGTRRASISRSANKLKRESKKKMWRCERKSITRRCSRTSLVRRKRWATCWRKPQKWRRWIRRFSFWVRRGRARSLSLGPFTSNRNVRVELLFA